MSWSVTATGRPEAVKIVLARQFETAKANCKGYTFAPHEAKSVELIEQIVNDQLNFLASKTPVLPVKVSASGSASADSAGGGYTNVLLEVTPMYGFIESAS